MTTHASTSPAAAPRYCVVGTDLDGTFIAPNPDGPREQDIPTAENIRVWGELEVR